MTEIYQRHRQLIENRTTDLQTDTYFGNVLHEANYSIVAKDAANFTHESMIRFAEWLPKSGYVTWDDGITWHNDSILKTITTEQLLELYLKEK